jgi:hypothetical protein
MKRPIVDDDDQPRIVQANDGTWLIMRGAVMINRCVCCGKPFFTEKGAATQIAILDRDDVWPT